jgi:hypothetical protein
MAIAVCALLRATTMTIVLAAPNMRRSDVHRAGSPERACSMDIILLAHETINQRYS